MLYNMLYNKVRLVEYDHKATNRETHQSCRLQVSSMRFMAALQKVHSVNKNKLNSVNRGDNLTIDLNSDQMINKRLSTIPFNCFPFQSLSWLQFISPVLAVRLVMTVECYSFQTNHNGRRCRRSIPSSTWNRTAQTATSASADSL